MSWRFRPNPPLSRPSTAGESPTLNNGLNYEFIVANATSHRAELIELNVEYLAWVFAGIEEHFAVVGMPTSEYVPCVIDKVCGDPPPKRIFYLVKVDDTRAGTGCLQFLHPGVAEIKRIYFRHEFRGMKLGELTLSRLLTDVRAFGYRSFCLDTALFMRTAHRLYEKDGFSDLPHTRAWKCLLSSAAAGAS